MAAHFRAVFEGFDVEVVHDLCLTLWFDRAVVARTTIRGRNARLEHTLEHEGRRRRIVVEFHRPDARAEPICRVEIDGHRLSLAP